MKFYFFNKILLTEALPALPAPAEAHMWRLHLFLTDEGHTPVAVLLIYPFLEDSGARVILAGFCFRPPDAMSGSASSNAGKTGVFVDIYC